MLSIVATPIGQFDSYYKVRDLPTGQAGSLMTSHRIIIH